MTTALIIAAAYAATVGLVLTLTLTAARNSCRTRDRLDEVEQLELAYRLPAAQAHR